MNPREAWRQAGYLFAAHRAWPYARLARHVASAASPPAVDPLICLHTVRLAALKAVRELGPDSPPDGPRDPWSGDIAAFRADLVRLSEAVAAAGSRGLVQFTDPQRMTDVLPGLLLAASRYPGQPIHLVEMGSCAGLLLSPASYRISYAAGIWESGPGTNGRAVALKTGLDVPVRVLAQPLTIASSVGVDLNPVDVTSPEALDYLRAYLWPGDPNRERRLGAAVRALAVEPPDLRAGDAAQVMPDLLRQLLGRDCVTLVVDSSASRYLPAAATLRLGRALDQLARQGHLVMVARRPHGSLGFDELRVVDLTRRWVARYAVSDSLSERSTWMPGADALSR